MNLIVDIGNTLVKLAVFKGDKLLVKFSVPEEAALKIIKEIFFEYTQIRRSIVSSVRKLDNHCLEYLKIKSKLLVLDANTPVPFTNLYKTPRTLGLDRVALISASVRHYFGKPTLVIDAGTCVTFDFKDDKNAYLGGGISPGLQMRYKALNQFTANLPVLEPTEVESIIGRSTEESMHSGVVYGLVKEIDGVIAEYQNKYGDLTVILTGGDANFLSKQLKSSIFANPNFLMEGLNNILQFNAIE
ncbi:type III pantothenate kinase [Mangrovimonas aestuarii]|uniref:type III pantothenate kinase n=1 Tax=Mangrovimonas aestuarii TaxID=3018443 RepID=UPI002379FB08|nr:type III pantothenate kinase [Mangrovimonas aestuarii]